MKALYLFIDISLFVFFAVLAILVSIKGDIVPTVILAAMALFFLSLELDFSKIIRIIRRS